MACGSVVVGSATPPVQKFIRQCFNGWLVDFFDVDQLAQQIFYVLCHPEQQTELRSNARQTVVDHYDLHSVCFPHQIDVVNTLLVGDFCKPVVPAAEVTSVLYSGVNSVRPS
tara:strand:+ start:1018 stop:1353 length:336 start_codon:yes stop_codon:yes gene_type:complete